MKKTKKVGRVRHMAQRAILSVITAVGVGLSAAACSSGAHPEPMTPRDGKESLKPIGSKSGEAQSEESPVDNDGELNDGAEQSNEPAPKIPEVLYPNGVEARLTPPGTELRFGEPAIVASADAEGRLLVWSVTPYQGIDLAPEQVALAPAAAAEGNKEYVCFAYDIAYLGAVAKTPGRDDVVPGVGDISGAAVVPPELVPGTTEGETTTRLVGGADDACGIPPASRVPVALAGLTANYPYARAAVAAVKPGSDAAARPVTLMYLFDHGLPGVADAGNTVEPIIWG